MADELKPCPFCGQDAGKLLEVIHRQRIGWSIRCQHCGSRSSETATHEGTTTVWNTRALLSQPERIYTKEDAEALCQLAVAAVVKARHGSLIQLLHETAGYLRLSTFNQGDQRIINKSEQLDAAAFALSAAAPDEEAKRQTLEEKP